MNTLHKEEGLNGEDDLEDAPVPPPEEVSNVVSFPGSEVKSKERESPLTQSLGEKKKIEDEKFLNEIKNLKEGDIISSEEGTTRKFIGFTKEGDYVFEQKYTSGDNPDILKTVIRTKANLLKAWPKWIHSVERNSPEIDNKIPDEDNKEGDFNVDSEAIIINEEKDLDKALNNEVNDSGISLEEIQRNQASEVFSETGLRVGSIFKIEGRRRRLIAITQDDEDETVLSCEELSRDGENRVIRKDDIKISDFNENWKMKKGFSIEPIVEENNQKLTAEEMAELEKGPAIEKWSNETFGEKKELEKTAKSLVESVSTPSGEKELIGSNEWAEIEKMVDDLSKSPEERVKLTNEETKGNKKSPAYKERSKETADSIEKNKLMERMNRLDICRT